MRKVPRYYLEEGHAIPTSLSTEILARAVGVNTLKGLYRKYLDNKRSSNITPAFRPTPEDIRHFFLWTDEHYTTVDIARKMSIGKETALRRFGLISRLVLNGKIKKGDYVK